jgi:site-specific DNA recombinase
MRVALYSRVSSQEQAQHGVSLAEQKGRLGAWAKMEGWKVAGLYSDGGFSGGNDNRPELQRLMEDARARLFDAVLVTKIDRFFRNTRLLLNYIHELEQHQVIFMAQAEGVNTAEGGIGKVTLNLLGAVAEWERERIGERIRDFRTHLASKGQWSSGRTTFGYRHDKKTKELVVDPLEAEAVRFIFETYIKGNIGIIRTAEVCNAKGLITPRPGRRQHTTWTQSAIRHVLTHPAYKGGPNETWPFKTPAIVSQETWEAAQRRLKNNKHFRAGNSHSPFQGLLRCGLCYHILRVGWSHNERRVIECVGRLRRLHLDDSPRCTLPRLDADQLEVRLNSEIKRIFNEPATLKKHILETVKNFELEKAGLERRLQPIQGNLDRIQKALTKLKVEYDLDQLSTEEYMVRVRGLKAKQADLERQSKEADPMLLRDLKEIEGQIKYLQGFAEFQDAIAEEYGRPAEVKADKRRSRTWAKSSPGDIMIGPFGESAPELMRKYGLAAFVYPDHIEIKGNLGMGRKANITPDCRSGRYPRFQ